MEKVVNYIKKDYKNILICILLIVINIFALNNLHNTYTIDKEFDNYWLILFISIIIEIGLFILIRIMHKKKVKIENIFLAIAIPIGLCYLVFIPLGRVPDERNHFARAYEISEGHLISSKNENDVGGQIINTDNDDIFKTSNDRLRYNDILKNIEKAPSQEKKFVAFPNMSLYAFICYVPQVIGISLGKALSLSTTMVGYLGRLTNLAVWILLMYFSIKKIPYKKLTILLFALMPMILQEAASLAADALTNGMAFFLISYTLYVKNKKDKLNKKDYIILTLSSIIMSLCKIVYLPLCLILLLIPYNKFNSKKDKYLKIGLLAIFVIIINLIWLKISSSFLNEIRPGVDPTSQVYYVLHNPVLYAQAFFKTIYDSISLLIFNIIGISLCYFDVNSSSVYILLYFVLIIFSLVIDNDKKVDKYDKTLSVLIGLSTIALMFTSLYVQWNPLGADFIDGVQGRYFIPLLLPLALICNNKIKAKDSNDYSLLISNLVIFINIYIILLLFYNHI